MLRAKYFDWCSARVAERFISLDVREIYELAGVSGSGEDLSFTEVVDRATETLASRMSLPTFEDWSESYRADPQKYDVDLAGFWKDHI